MIITALRTARLEVPIAKPIRTAIHEVRSVGVVVVWLDTDDGATGEGMMMTLGTRRLDVLEAMVKSLENQVIGHDPGEVETIWQDMWRDINFFGHKGITIFALAAIDTVCWDLVGKAAGTPLYKLFGACREAVKAYASGGLWLSSDMEELAAEARSFVDQGFRAMKVRVGKPGLEEDVRRVAAVRAAVGPDIGLMADANQGLSVDHAIRLGKRLEDLGLVWFEEPVPAYDLKGHAAIAEALDVPVASGETEYTSLGMGAMLEAKAADILMPDLQRMGGLTEFRKVARMADGHGVPVSPHIFSEQSLSIAGSEPNVTYLEHMPWFAPLFRESMVLEDGMIAMPQGPGLGFSVDADAAKRFRLP
jgi:L-alanine-DL-glutamate epimerase-like enolase superfamily enzyme